MKGVPFGAPFFYSNGAGGTMLTFALSSLASVEEAGGAGAADGGTFSASAG
jgi:hypothetical protein